MATSWSDPSLNTKTLASTDQLALLRPSTVAGETTTYAPKNITISDFGASLFLMALNALGPTLPTSEPDGGGWWLNAGALTYTAGTGTGSGQTLTVAAFIASFKAALAASPTSSTTVGDVINNAGNLTEIEE